MSEVVTDFGEEWETRQAWQDLQSTEVEVLLYNDGTDNIQEGDDIDAITTELTGSSYSRQTVQLPNGVSFNAASGAARMDFNGVSFDLTDNTGETFDALAVVDTFQSEVFANDGSAQEHLLGTYVFETSYPVNDYTGTSTINNFGRDMD